MTALEHLTLSHSTGGQQRARAPAPHPSSSSGGGKKRGNARRCADSMIRLDPCRVCGWRVWAVGTQRNTIRRGVVLHIRHVGAYVSSEPDADHRRKSNAHAATGPQQRRTGTAAETGTRPQAERQEKETTEEQRGSGRTRRGEKRGRAGRWRVTREGRHLLAAVDDAVVG